ncbi:hypothetical protein A6519_001914 [Escherichia coli]|nr:hypothetical protein [Escherichia coli]
MHPLKDDVQIVFDEDEIVCYCSLVIHAVLPGKLNICGDMMVFIFTAFLILILRYRFLIGRRIITLNKVFFILYVFISAGVFYVCCEFVNASRMLCYDVYCCMFYIVLFMALIALILTLLFISLRSPLPGIRLTPLFSVLRVDIDRRYQMNHGFLNKEIYTQFVHDLLFIMNEFPQYKKIILESHLLRHYVRKHVSDRLAENGISHRCDARKTPLWEIIFLNIKYGGKTRYRLLSCRKHPNSFKAHRHGGRFTIILPGRHATPGDISTRENTAE